MLDSKLDLNNLWLVSDLTLSDIMDEQKADVNVQNFSNGYKQLKSKKLWKVFSKSGILMAQKKNSDEELIIIPMMLSIFTLLCNTSPKCW